MSTQPQTPHLITPRELALRTASGILVELSWIAGFEQLACEDWHIRTYLETAAKAVREVERGLEIAGEER